MHTVNELKPQIGQKVWVRFESVLVRCTILDAKSAYGRARFQVTPTGPMQDEDKGNAQWVESDRFKEMI